MIERKSDGKDIGSDRMTPAKLLKKIKTQIKKEWEIAFLSAFLIGLAIHLPAMIFDIPNHDGLSSMYFDQNMITSGRWFLTVACGFSSYFTIPWLIGILSLLFLALASAALTELLEFDKTWEIVLGSALLVSFPSLSSTFAYVFTMDGYMMALLLAVLSVLFTKKYRRGFLPGAVCLAFSMGIYQAYLSFAILLCIYCILICLADGKDIKQKIKSCLNYLYMGMLGCGLYFIILQLLLKIQGKELASYQGINSGIGGNAAAQTGILTTIKGMYADFFAFSVKNPVLHNNLFTTVALILLAAATAVVLFQLCKERKWWKNPNFFVIIGLLIVCLPLASNVILLISPEVNYHLLMRYQWVLYPILMLAFCGRYAEICVKMDTDGMHSRETDIPANNKNDNIEIVDQKKQADVSTGRKTMVVVEWCVFCAAFVLAFSYSVTDNIAYSNLQKRYEKTYAYCVRLLDRIEQTEGYYQGIPIAMVGVVGDEQFPLTDITGNVTSGMIGMSGDSLLYTGANYQAFMKNYLGATLNFMTPEEMAPIYYTDEYIAMDSFPGEESTKVVDGILYVRTENVCRE